MGKKKNLKTDSRLWEIKIKFSATDKFFSFRFCEVSKKFDTLQNRLNQKSHLRKPICQKIISLSLTENNISPIKNIAEAKPFFSFRCFTFAVYFSFLWHNVKKKNRNREKKEQSIETERPVRFCFNNIQIGKIKKGTSCRFWLIQNL